MLKDEFESRFLMECGSILISQMSLSFHEKYIYFSIIFLKKRFIILCFSTSFHKKNTHFLIIILDKRFIILCVIYTLFVGPQYLRYETHNNIHTIRKH